MCAMCRATATYASLLVTWSLSCSNTAMAMNTYSFAADRVVLVKDNLSEISIREQGSEVKRAFFTPARWAEFRRQLKEIDKAAQNARDDKPVLMRVHYGSGWYVSVNNQVPCIDLRRWYLTKTNQVCPTKVSE